jgi:predicted anti-sigma-YlaC factor YlaD
MRFPRLRLPRFRKLNGHDITCRQAVALVTAYLDGELTRDRHALFEAHLDECEDCTEYFRQIRTTIALTGQLRDEDLDPTARDQLVTLYRRWRSDLDA